MSLLTKSILTNSQSCCDTLSRYGRKVHKFSNRQKGKIWNYKSRTTRPKASHV